jgi:DNA helicase HerA-like ATPase
LKSDGGTKLDRHVTFVLGREREGDAPVTRLGAYRALDGSEGAPLFLDLDGPHAVLIVGKRGYGKSHTLGVVAEGLARAPGVAPVVVDPMGAFDRLTDPADGDPVPARVVDQPSVAPSSLDPRSWCELLGLSPESGAGGLVWQAAGARRTLDGMREFVAAAGAPDVDERAAVNHLDLAATWGVFDPDGLTATGLAEPAVTVLDVAGLDEAPMNAVVRGVAEALYEARVGGRIDRLPWLLVDEAHAFFEGVAASALRTLLTRGRAPGVSFVAATQRPGAVPEVGISQSDLLVAHRLTAETDLAALESARPTYANAPLEDRMPTEPGEVVVVDDATETVHSATVRSRDTPHGGGSPRASEAAGSGP